MKAYLKLIEEVLAHGEERADRTGTGTLSLFGMQARYDLREGFPLLTTKKVYFSSLVKELFWFLRGETNIASLGSGIWDAWADENGDLGPIYGYQWRRWGESKDRPGIDQIAAVVKSLREDPFSRRHIVSAWNPEALPEMALPPCHAFFQFYVGAAQEEGGKRRLDCQLYQRSGDLAVGVPFNIASYALLLILVADATDMEPGFLVHTLGDAHLYLNHLDGVKKQLKREVRALPTCRLKKKVDLSSPEAFNLEPEDLELIGYEPHPFIKFPVAV